MSKASNYRQHAAECRALARAARNEEHRNQLNKMAEAWENFAGEAERTARAYQTAAEGPAE